MFDAYLNVEGVPGESTASGFEEMIPVLSYSHNVTQPTAAVASTGGGATSGRCVHGDFQVNVELCKATPLIDQKCSDGSHIPTVTLTLVRSGGESNVPFMEYKLTNVVIANSSISGGAGGGVPTHAVAFNYGKIEWTYTQTKRPDGGGGGKTTGSWNLETNAAK